MPTTNIMLTVATKPMVCKLCVPEQMQTMLKALVQQLPKMQNTAKNDKRERKIPKE